MSFDNRPVALTSKSSHTLDEADPSEPQASIGSLSLHPFKTDGLLWHNLIKTEL